MDQPTKKKQKVDDSTTCNEEVLFNTDTLSKIVSFLPSLDLLNLALTCKRFGISDDDELSIIKKSTHLLVQEIATEEQLAALPHYDGESSLADYHYLQLLKEPLTFDQLVGGPEYNGWDKSCVRQSRRNILGHPCWGTAFSDNIMRAGKHYVLFTSHRNDKSLMMGVLRPGQSDEDTKGTPLDTKFYRNFSRTKVGRHNNNNVHCCMYNTNSGNCHTSDWQYWGGEEETDDTWDGMESASAGDEIGMLLDLDEGTLSVYNNGRKLGIIKRGLAGQYCWAVSLYEGEEIIIKRGTIQEAESFV